MSESTSANNKRIAKNTIYLYSRSIIVMIVSIYTSRIVLQALGVDDYGVYNVVGGFVSMFSLLSGSLVNASQRFISFEMGKSSPQLEKVFCGTITIHIFLAIILLIIFETAGLWILFNYLNIAETRINAAFWVFQCSVFTFCVNLLSIPYTATIVAHEKMSFFAYISLFEVVAKLVVAFVVLYMPAEKLVVYSILTMAISLLLRIIYARYCSKSFQECKYHFVFDKALIKSMLSFSGWNFIGNAATTMGNQGITILLNLYFGVVLNAARGVAEQVNVAVNSFVSNFMMAMNPQITKSYASRDFNRMNELMYEGSKFSAFLYITIASIIYTEADFILNIWLVEVPSYSLVFLRLTIIHSLFMALSHPLYIGMLATGKIKRYQIVMGGIMIGGVCLCYMIFKFGYGPEWCYYSVIIVALIQLFVRLRLLEQMIDGFSGFKYFKATIFRVIAVFLPMAILLFSIRRISFNSSALEFLLVLLADAMIMPVLIYTLGLKQTEKVVVRNKIGSTLQKFLKK